MPPLTLDPPAPQLQPTTVPNLAQHTLPSPFTNTTPPPTLLTQGAEALVYQTHFLDQSAPAILKFRPSKAYRHATLDARLTKQRVLAEARVLVKLAGVKGCRVPRVLGLEWDVGRKVKGTGDGVVRVREGAAGVGKGAWIIMEFIDGKSVKELLREMDAWVKRRGELVSDEEKVQVEREVKGLLRRVGRTVGVMHKDGGVVHGDLTSSNIMVRSRRPSNGDPSEEDRMPDLNGEIVLIDFGLAAQSIQDEDRAVDLYVLERAFGSTHPKQEDWFDEEVLQSQEGYRGSFKGANVVLKRLEEVRMRGRKRSMIG